LRAISAALLLAVLLAGPAAANTAVLPVAVGSVLPQARIAGQGALRWLGMPIYEATLWTDGAGWSEAAVFALDIRYSRRITGRRLAATSLDEMRRMALGDERQLQRWLERMERIFPDVGPGDRLVGLNLPGRGVEFHSDDRVLGRVEDADFARAFFSIWLDPRTREPGLRAALLGNSGRAR